MPQVGRNDPCPCGSGKKYKNCHMRRDQAAASRDLNVRADEAALLNQLYQYAQSQRCAYDLCEAVGVYWGGRYDMEGVNQLEPDDMRRLFEWFMHDYHTSNARRYVLAQFIATQATGLPPEVLKVLAPWAKSAGGAFRVLEPDDDGYLRLFDLFRQEEIRGRDAALSRNAHEGDLLVGRLFEMDGAKRLSYMTLILPGEYEPGLVEYVMNAYQLYRDEHYQATWDEFLRENGHLFNAFFLSPKGEHLRKFVGPGTRFHDPAQARDRLREFTRQRAIDRQREQAEEQGQARPSPEHRTSTGLILPGAEPTPAPATQKKAEQPARPSILLPGRDF